MPAKRASLSEKISDVLVTHGNRDVVLSVTRNEGARISDAGYTKLVDRSINDEVLAICVSMRKDIPQEHFNALIAKASEVVFKKLAASNPHAVYEVHRVLTDITGQDPAGQPKAKRDYREAAAQFDDRLEIQLDPMDLSIIEAVETGAQSRAQIDDRSGRMLSEKTTRHVVENLGANSRGHLRRHDARQLIDPGEIVIELTYGLDRFFVLDNRITALRFTRAQVEG